ncbi:MAG: acyl-CoA thioesterase II, partial [Gammaproteobacteria bacterium]|nr:acyl-CoA thioesterase II [Gammaproteobacteria bacterium]
LLAQCLMAAQATAGDDRACHALHAAFLRPGDVDAPVEIAIERVRDGRSFSSRQAVASQHGKERFRMLASFQVPAESPAYCEAVMPNVPPPEDMSATYDDFTLAQTGESSWYGSDRPMDIRYVNPPMASRGEPVTEPQLMWMRIRDKLPPATDSPHLAGLHRAGLVYLSDATLVDHVMLPHGLRWQDDDFLGTSLDHGMWLHRPAAADQWLLFEQSVVVTGNGRGLAHGRFFERGGELVATCVQEGLMRWA